MPISYRVSKNDFYKTFRKHCNSTRSALETLELKAIWD